MNNPHKLLSNCNSYLFPEEDMCIHIIRTSFSESKRYIVVFEDAYQTKVGETQLLSSKEILEKFNITL